MLDTSDPVCFVATTDLASARAFYEGVLGLRVADENPGACVLDANGTSLRVTLVDEAVIAPYTVLGWSVDDIEAAARALVDRGVHLTRYDGLDQDELGIWTAPGGDRVAWFADPAGNTLRLTQPGG